EAASLRRSALGDVPGAVDALARALALRPHSTLIVGELRELLEKTEDDARLAEVYEAHLQALEGPFRTPVAHALGRLYAARLGDRERALRLYAEAHASNPLYREVWLPLANLQFAEGEPAAAEEPYRRAVEGGPPPPPGPAGGWGRLRPPPPRGGGAPAAPPAPAGPPRRGRRAAPPARRTTPTGPRSARRSRRRCAPRATGRRWWSTCSRARARSPRRPSASPSSTRRPRSSKAGSASPTRP